MNWVLSCDLHCSCNASRCTGLLANTPERIKACCSLLLLLHQPPVQVDHLSQLIQVDRLLAELLGTA